MRRLVPTIFFFLSPGILFIFASETNVYFVHFFTTNRLRRRSQQFRALRLAAHAGRLAAHPGRLAAHPGHGDLDHRCLLPNPLPR